jgi:Flagellar biosynthesis protein, FliO
VDQIQPYLWVIYTAGGVLLLILLAIILTRVLGGSIRGKRGSRLGISEYYEIDKTRRLVLIRRDDVEHLVLIGGGQDVVVESGVSGPMGGNVVQAQPVRNAPRPTVFAPRRAPLRPIREEPEM